MYKYFKEEEFECPCCKENKTDSKLITLLDALRDDLGEPMVITSGYRCPEHNEAVGGSENSSHLKGLAADISCATSHDRFKLLSVLFKYFDRIGIAKTFIHVDIDEDKPKQLTWTY